MRRLRSYLKLSGAEKWLLIRSILWLWLFWLGLRVLSFQKLYRLVERFSKPGSSGRGHPPAPGLISKSVEKSGRYILGQDSCFPQALTGFLLLKRAGYAPRLYIGVKKNESTLDAHAWIEMDGEILIGGPLSVIERYSALPEIDQTSL
jgi:hypothetical protein